MKKTGKINLRPLADSLDRKARLLELAGDRTRIRILYLMLKKGKACVGEIADQLDMNITCISHHLQIMRDNGFFVTERNGTSICYILKKDEFVKSLKRIILDGKVAKPIVK